MIREVKFESQDRRADDCGGHCRGGLQFPSVF